jgi:AraC-like DNA-binding protein
VQFLGVRVPRKTIAPLLVRPEDVAMRVISGRAGALPLLTRYVSAVLDAETLAVPDASPLVATHLHDLIGLAVGATRDAAEVAKQRGVRASRLAAIKCDILARLGDESLTISAVAARQRITPRYVHKLFENEGTTYTRFVLEQRLDRAYRLLSDPRTAGRDISAIAYDVGFGDLSYFNRTFRRRFHGTPSDIRHAAGRR